MCQSLLKFEQFGLWRAADSTGAVEAKNIEGGQQSIARAPECDLVILQRQHGLFELGALLESCLHQLVHGLLLFRQLIQADAVRGDNRRIDERRVVQVTRNGPA